MATFGTANEGKDNIIGPSTYTSSLSLGLYTNSADSLDASSVLADITEPSGSGYARVDLTGVWAFSNGVVTYSPNPNFENTDGGANWTGDVVGAFITDGTYLLHFLDRAGGAITMTPGKVIQVDISTLLE